MAGHAALAVVLLRTVYPRLPAPRRRALLGWWSAKLLRILNISPRVEGKRPRSHERGAMIAANHVSWLDIFVVASVHPTRFIAKSEIRQWGLMGWIADRAGTLFIRRDQLRDTARINAVVHDALAGGDCVGLFPEGITTEGDELRKFHSALFEPAVANQAHVHPVAIRYERSDGDLCREASFRGERTFFESLSLIIGEPAIVARIGFAPTVETAGAHRREVAAQCEARIASVLGVHPSRGTAPGKAAGPPAETR